jgi:hypothetical protein
MPAYSTRPATLDNLYRDFVGAINDLNDKLLYQISIDWKERG